VGQILDPESKWYGWGRSSGWARISSPEEPDEKPDGGNGVALTRWH
jgi:hypothetical protein